MGAIIWYITMFGCALLFFGIGIYAGKLEKPMWFWSGSDVDPKSITDIPAYNHENARMWKLYSLWYWAAGLLQLVNMTLALIVLILSCTVGMAILVGTYMKISKKYSVEENKKPDR